MLQQLFLARNCTCMHAVQSASSVVHVLLLLHAPTFPASMHAMSLHHAPTADLDREVLALKREEEKLIREIKAAAKTNNQASLKILAKSLVRLRAQIAKLHGSAANLKGVSTNLTVSGCCWSSGSSALAQLQTQQIASNTC
jgi:hypothetical protein